MCRYPRTFACVCVPRMRSKKYGFVAPGISNAIVCVRPDDSDRACGLGEYPNSVAMLSTRLRRSSLTRPGWVSALQTVEVATPAALATSEIVTTELSDPRRLIKTLCQIGNRLPCFRHGSKYRFTRSNIVTNRSAYHSVATQLGRITRNFAILNIKSSACKS